LTTFHDEVMPEMQRVVLARLGPILTPRGFYLVGGTAAAIRLGHRRSVDLDWFSDAGPEDATAFAADLRTAGLGRDLVVRSTGPGTLHGTISGVLVSFLRYSYPMMAEPEDWPAYGCRLASIEDLVCMKLSAVAQRGARKDFYDLAALAETGYTLKSMLEMYRLKYQTDDVGHLLASLVFFDDAEHEPDPHLLKPVAWEDVKLRFRGWVKAFAG